MLGTRISIVVIIMLQLFLLVAAHYPAPHASVGSPDGFPAADRRRTSAAVVGDHKDMEKVILWRRKMGRSPPHKSPSGPHNFSHQRRLVGTTSSQREDPPPSPPPATKNSGLDGTGGDDVITTKMKEVIICSGGKHNHDGNVVAASRCRRWRRRRLIAAVPRHSQPSPAGYHRVKL